MGAALSRGKRRFSKRQKNAQEKPAALPVPSPKRIPLPALEESAPALTRYNDAISVPESVFPELEPLPHTPQRPPPFYSIPGDASQESSFLCNKTFRLRGVDREWDHDHVKRQVQASFDLSDAAQVHIRSISPDPSDSKRKIATLELTELPSGITHAGCPSEWMPRAREEDLVLDTNFFGLTPLHETDDAKCTLNVIAVPGLNGHAFGSFKGRSGGRTYMWLRDSLAKELPHARIFTYGYNTELQGSHSFENIGDLALKLQHAIKVVSNNEGINTVRATVLIGHSLGGIVIKQALKNMFVAQSTDRTTVESIRGLLFFGVPNQGMAIESLIPMVNNQPNRQLVETLNENSDVLRHVTDDFNTSFKSSHVKVVCFYETLQSPTAIQVDGIWSMSGPPAILVNRHSATQRRQNEEDTMFPIQATHSGMVKFENKFTQTYKIVLDHLNDVVEKAQVVIRELSKSENNCLKSLSFSAQDTRQENIHTARGTCDWLSLHPTYSEWFGAHRQLLWINGKPGAGKSTLMKHLSNTLMNDKSSDDYILASFFVYGQGDEMERSKLGILRSLLHQILPQLPDRLSILTEKFAKREKTRKTWVWGQEELMESLNSIATQGYHGSRPIIILVDALDELGENLARDVVRFLGTLITQSPDANDSTTSTGPAYIGMRICFSSRHFPDITPPDCLSICVEKNNSDDIAKVVHEKLSVPRSLSIKQPENSNLRELEGFIIAKADGVFQWVVLVVEQILNPLAASKKASALRMTAERLPSELAPLYAKILENSSFETFQLLQWICFCRRPLRIFELRQALALSSGQTHTSLEEYEKHFEHELNEEMVQEMLKNLSHGLVEVEKISQSGRQTQVGFIHQSVHDYLLKDGLLQIAGECGIPSFLDPAIQNFAHLEAFSNAQIAAACIKFLQSKEVQENLKSIDFYDLPEDLALGKYAKDYWLSHMTRSLKDDGIPEFLLGLFLGSVRILLPCPNIGYESVMWSRVAKRCYCERMRRKLDDHWSQAYRSQLYSYEGLKTMLHWLIAARSYPILEVLTNSGQSLDTPDETGRTPLMEAILTVDIKATTLLLDSGLVDVNWKDEHNQTPLHHAATDLSSLDIFASLLEKITIACDEMDQDGYTPLLRSLKLISSHDQFCPQYSAQGPNLLQAARWLLDGGKVNPNQTNPEGNSALAHAAREGYSAIVELLINIPDVDINSRNKDGKTPIIHAVERGQRGIFTLLLENEYTSLNLEDHSGRNTLSYAVERMEPQDVAKLIRKPNVGLDKQDNSLRTPLSYSVWSSGDVSQMLLDTNDVDPFLKDNKGRSPVSYAAEYRHTNTFERLWMFDNKSNRWNEPDSRDRTPLSYAAQCNPTAVKLLLDDSRITLNQADCDGRTPLSYAAQCNPTAVRLLLDGPQIARNQADCSGRTPLSYAAEHNPTTVKQLLDDSRIARNQGDRYGHTPLWYAVVNGNLESLRHFLSDREVDKKAIDHPILHKAIACRDAVTASLLIQSGWDVNMKDSFHRTPLFHVSNLETAYLLLNAEGIDFEARDRDGRTALFSIAKNRCPEVIRLLIEEYGFDDEAKDRSRLFPWHCAEDHETKKLLFGPFKRLAREHRDRRAARSILAANPKGR